MIRRSLESLMILKRLLGIPDNVKGVPKIPD